LFLRKKELERKSWKGKAGKEEAESIFVEPV
jgi:hypothetical protein